MSLNLSIEDQAEYLRCCAINQAAKEVAMAAGNTSAAKKARQANTALHKEFEQKQLPPEVVEMPDRLFCGLTLEQRIARIENYLGLN